MQATSIRFLLAIVVLTAISSVEHRDIPHHSLATVHYHEDRLEAVTVYGNQTSNCHSLHAQEYAMPVDTTRYTTLSTLWEARVCIGWMLSHPKPKFILCSQRRRSGGFRESRNRLKNSVYVYTVTCKSRSIPKVMIPQLLHPSGNPSKRNELLPPSHQHWRIPPNPFVIFLFLLFVLPWLAFSLHPPF